MSAVDVSLYESQGAVVLRGVLSSHEVALLQSGIEEVLKCPSRHAQIASDPGGYIGIGYITQCIFDYFLYNINYDKNKLYALTSNR